MNIEDLRNEILNNLNIASQKQQEVNSYKEMLNNN